jgi:hypothetical protein
MYFKVKVTLHKLTIGFHEQEPLTFRLGDQHGTSVMIRPPTVDEKEKQKGEFLVCFAFTEEEPPSGINKIFESLIQSASEHPTEPDEKQGALLSRDFQNFASQVRHRLYESIRRTVRIIRWRWALTSSHNPIASTSGVSWSLDNHRWLTMPEDLHFEGGRFEFYFRISARLHGEMEALIKGGENEPVGHELFLEAWALRRTNPRSALIIGMSAAEVGFKQCIGKLVPPAEWLAHHAPTPPLDKMLSNYLPLLPAKLKIEGRVLKPSKKIRSSIKAGIEARNHSVHLGSEPPKGKDLKELLLSIRDLLYLLDFYCGFEWALEYIRDEVRAEMVEEFELKSTNAYSVIDLR